MALLLTVPAWMTSGPSSAISASGVVAYIKDHQVWLAKLDASENPFQIVVRGNSADPQWSPDGTKLAFVSSRTDHAFIAVYDPWNKSLRYLSPSVDSDQTPRWSPDGKFLYLNFQRSIYAIPLRPGQMLPPLPASGLRTDKEVAALPRGPIDPAT